MCRVPSLVTLLGRFLLWFIVVFFVAIFVLVPFSYEYLLFVDPLLQ
jgi:hypothetical protein